MLRMELEAVPKNGGYVYAFQEQLYKLTKSKPLKNTKYFTCCIQNCKASSE